MNAPVVAATTQLLPFSELKPKQCKNNYIAKIVVQKIH